MALFLKMIPVKFWLVVVSPYLLCVSLGVDHINPPYSSSDITGFVESIHGSPCLLEVVQFIYLCSCNYTGWQLSRASDKVFPGPSWGCQGLEPWKVDTIQCGAVALC